MQLTKIDFKNFRSINDVTIDINNHCTIFVGKNEAGKSNLLKAIAGGLSPEAYKITAKDKRKKGPNETIDPNDYYIKYYFDLNNEDIENLIDEYFDDDIYNNLFKLGDKILTKEEFIQKYFSKGLYKYDISKLKGWGMYYILPKTLILAKKMAEVVSDCTDNEGNSYTNGTLIDLDKIVIDSSYYKEYSVENAIQLFTLFTRNYILGI